MKPVLAVAAVVVTAAAILIGVNNYQLIAQRGAKTDLVARHAALSVEVMAAGDLRDAVTIAQTAVTLRPASAVANKALLLATQELLIEEPELASKGLAESALVSLRHAVHEKRGDTDKVLVALGNAYLVLDDKRAAAKVLDRALKANPKSAPAHLFRGLIADKALPRDAGIDLVEKATRLRPNYRRALLAHGQLTLAAGRTTEALESLQKVVEIKADAIAYAALGDTHMKLDQPVDAEAAYAEALRFQPEWQDGKLKLAEAKVQVGKFREALKVLIPLGQSTNLRDARVLRLLGMAHRGLKNYRESLNMFRMWEKLEGPNAENAWLAAQVALQLGANDLAGAALDNFIAVAKGQPELEEQLAEAHKALAALSPGGGGVDRGPDARPWPKRPPMPRQ